MIYCGLLLSIFSCFEYDKRGKKNVDGFSGGVFNDPPNNLRNEPPLSPNPLFSRDIMYSNNSSSFRLVVIGSSGYLVSYNSFRLYPFPLTDVIMRNVLNIDKTCNHKGCMLKSCPRLCFGTSEKKLSKSRFHDVKQD